MTYTYQAEFFFFVCHEIVFYSKSGDGHNDICPVLRLGAGDYGLARKGFAMEREIGAVPKELGELNAKFQIWSDGRDLEKIIFDCLSGG